MVIDPNVWVSAVINPFGVPARLVEAVTADLYPDPDTPAPRVRDPNDDYLVALAETAVAVIVTGDADLLDADLETPAITARDLLERIT